MTNRGCFKCDGTGKICNICGESESAYQNTEDEIEAYLEENDSDQFDECDDCEGTGL